MAKLGKILKAIIVGSLWTCVLLFAGNKITLFFWKFNLLSAADWQLIAGFWNRGGVIKTASDYLFVSTLFLIPIIWIAGWKRLMKVKIGTLLLRPFEAYSDWQAKRYENNSRIVLKNMGTTSVKETPKEKIKSDLKKIEKQIDNNKETAKIRENIGEKISRLKK